MASQTSLWRMPSILLLAGYTLAGFTGFFVTQSAVPLWLVNGGTPDSIAGLSTTVLLATTVITQLLTPAIIRRTSFRAVLVVGLVALGGPSLLLLIPGGLGWVLGICAVRGVGFGMIGVVGAVMAGTMVEPSRRGESVGIYGLAISVPNLLAVAGGVALVAADQFWLVAVLGAIPLVSLLTVPALGREASAAIARRPGPASSDSGVARRAAIRGAVAPTVVLFAITAAGGGFLTFVPIARPDGALATSALLTWGVTSAVIRWRVGRWADRVGLSLLLPATPILTMVGLGAIATGILATGTTEWVLVIAGAGMLGFGYGGAQSLTLVAAFGRGTPQATESISALWGVGFDSGTAVGTAMVGAVAGIASIPAGIGATALMTAATIPIALRCSRPMAVHLTR